MNELPYYIIQPLQIPDEAYADDIATIVVTGGSYGGMWALNATSTHLPPVDTEAIGSIETEDAPRCPELALEAAHHWISESCNHQGLTLAHFKDLNSTYGPDEAPFFSSGIFFIDRRKTDLSTRKVRQMRDIEWTVVGINGNGDEFQFEGETFDIGDFQQVRWPWGHTPDADWLESQGVNGWMPRGAGNDDPYAYVINLDSVHDEDSVKVALINTNELNGE